MARRVVLPNDVQAFFRKLKFQYLEQKAKDQYIKVIVSDDAPSISAADNQAQRAENEAKKQELKEAKLALAEMHSNIRTLSPLVEQGMYYARVSLSVMYNSCLDLVKAKAMTDEAVDLVEIDALLGAVVVDEAQLDPLGHFGEHREVRARPVVGGAQRVGGAGPGSDARRFGPCRFRRCHRLTLSTDRRGVRRCHHHPVAALIWRPSSGTIVLM